MSLDSPKATFFQWSAVNKRQPSTSWFLLLSGRTSDWLHLQLCGVSSYKTYRGRGEATPLYQGTKGILFPYILTVLLHVCWRVNMCPRCCAVLAMSSTLGCWAGNVTCLQIQHLLRASKKRRWKQFRCRNWPSKRLEMRSLATWASIRFLWPCRPSVPAGRKNNHDSSALLGRWALFVLLGGSFFPESTVSSQHA